MIIKDYSIINEKIYNKTLANGLNVVIIPKVGFKRSFVCFSTKYGSLINRFIPRGENEYVDMPLGIAHFLEHKMFDLPNGDDALNLFAGYGLDANASTNYLMTTYQFSGTNNIINGINVLLDFVQEPYFTDESVKKEQSIIIQELKMYLDDPNDALHLGLMQNLFQRYPFRYDVGGTIESIKDITKDTLYKCYHTFYHPSNMCLAIIGDPDNILLNQNNSIENLFNVVEENQSKKHFSEIEDLQIAYLVENEKVYKSTGSKKMDISLPKAALGIKLPFEKYDKNQAILTELKLKILIEIILGPTSDAFQELYDLELINGSLYYEVYIDGICGFIRIQANTYKPRAFLDYIKNKLLSFKDLEIDDATFNRFKKGVLGSFIKSLNSLEFIGFSYLEYSYKQANLFEGIELFSKITKDSLFASTKYFDSKAISEYIIYPKRI